VTLINAPFDAFLLSDWAVVPQITADDRHNEEQNSGHRPGRAMRDVSQSE